MQTAGRVDHQRVETRLLRVLHGAAHERQRIVRLLVLVNRDADRAADHS